MSAFDQNRAVPLGAITLFRVASAAEGIVEFVRSRYHARTTSRALARLSDHELKDIGIERAQIADVSLSLARR